MAQFFVVFQFEKLPVTDRGDIQGNLTGFKPVIFANEKLGGINLVPVSRIVSDGQKPSSELVAEGVTALDTFHVAYEPGKKPWSAGAD